MELIGYALFVLMGVTLGLIGAGGSILTIPILVYVFKMPVLLSTTYSLLIVGTSASISMFWYRRYIAHKNALLFAIPSIAGVFFARFILIPRLPNIIFDMPLDFWLLKLLALFMLSAAYFMIASKTYYIDSNNKINNLYIKIISLALILGVIIGILGAGGGFIIIPVLVIFLRMEMKSAIATSLFIIAINSMVGFFSDRHYFDLSNYKEIAMFISLSLIGMIAGISLSHKFRSETLKKIFGWFVACLGILILIE